LEKSGSYKKGVRCFIHFFEKIKGNSSPGKNNWQDNPAKTFGIFDKIERITNPTPPFPLHRGAKALNDYLDEMEGLIKALRE